MPASCDMPELWDDYDRKFDSAERSQNDEAVWEAYSATERSKRSAKASAAIGAEVGDSHDTRVPHLRSDSAVALLAPPARTSRKSQSVVARCQPTGKPKSSRNRLRRLFGVAWLAVWLAVAGMYVGNPWEESSPLSSVPTIDAGSLTLASNTDGPELATTAMPASLPLDVQATKNIEDIRVGDLVLAQDEETGEIVAGEVVRLFENTVDHVRALRIRDSSGREQLLSTTNDHPFYVPDVGWVRAADLEVGTKLEQADGALATIVSSEYEQHPEGLTVYNFEVADVHTYYVADNATRGSPANAIWVHNKCEVQKVNGRNPINYKYAGKTYPVEKLSPAAQKIAPNGVDFKKTGFPDLSPFATRRVKVNNLTGQYAKDAAMANAKAKLDSIPSDMVWHHVEDAKTLLLIPKAIHNAVRHTGGSAIIRSLGL